MGLFRIDVNRTYFYNNRIYTFNRFISPLTGSDNNNGTITSPFATINRGNNNDYLAYLLNGKTVENAAIGYNALLMGDSKESEFDGILNCGYSSAVNLKIKTVNPAPNVELINCVINNILIGGYAGSVIENCLISNYENEYYGLLNGTKSFKNNTLLSFTNNCKSSTLNIILNCIFATDSINLKNPYSTDIEKIPKFQHCLFMKQTAWKWGNVNIPITYGGNADNFITDLKAGLTVYSLTLATDEKLYLQSIIDNSFPNSNRIVDDLLYPIFNRYDIYGDVIDYSLRLHSANVALYMSDDDSYVGCYEANVGGMIFGDTKDVDINGVDTVNTPDLLVKNASGTFYASADSWQFWNRISTNVLTYPRGFSFVGLQSSLKSGIAARMYFGKKQIYNITDAPTLPFESVEVIPYDDLTTPSLFPRFSAPFNGNCQMWYHTTGIKANQPILFNDLVALGVTSNIDLNLYGVWAVTNADYENNILSTKTGVIMRNIPIKYVKLELNLHYAE